MWRWAAERRRTDATRSSKDGEARGGLAVRDLAQHGEENTGGENRGGVQGDVGGDAERAVGSVGRAAGVPVRDLDRHEHQQDAAERQREKLAEFGEGLHGSV